MIRVGFVITYKDNEYLGGINYFRNLIDAICTFRESKIEPVIFTGYECDLNFSENFPNVQIVKSRIFDSNAPCIRIRSLLQRKMHVDILFDRLLKKYNISLLSHYGSLVNIAMVPTIGWMPDFQHKYLPDFFSKEDLLARDLGFEKICTGCTSLIFSSYCAKNDAVTFYPEYSEKFRVLHFVTGHMDLSDLPDYQSLIEKYKIRFPYFIVPNQFWIHKNHMVILEAIKKLHSEGHPITIVATGKTHDCRQPEYFDVIRKKIQEYNISDNFIVVGIVPYRELLQLMIHAIAVINPSLFEGWSTIVEEAKVLNLKVILSDIPVHREQNPEKGIFFSPHDHKQLANILLSCIIDNQRSDPDEINELIIGKLIDKKKEYAEKYENIVFETIEEFCLQNNISTNQIRLEKISRHFYKYL